MAVDSERIIMLKIILTRNSGVFSVLNRVSPSTMPVKIANTSVNGKTNTEKISTLFMITGWKLPKKQVSAIKSGMAKLF